MASSVMGGAENEAAPPIAYMGGAARRVSAALLGAPSSSHAQKPPTNKTEGAAKEENVGAMHGRELRARVCSMSRRAFGHLCTSTADADFGDECFSLSLIKSERR